MASTDAKNNEVDKLIGNAWGWFGKARDAVKTATEKLPQSVNRALDQMKAMEDKPDDKVEAVYFPWDDVPTAWWARGGEWGALAKGIVVDDGTFLIGPERGLTKNESQALLANGISVDFKPMDANECLDKVTQELLNYKRLSDARFRLVPKFVREETFWSNYFWKLRELGKLKSIQPHARAFLMTLNAPRDLPEGPGMASKPPPKSLRDREVHAGVIESILKELEATEGRNAENVAMEKKHSNVLSLFEEGTEALKLLKECLDDEDMKEHLQVAYDSCLSIYEKLQNEVNSTTSDSNADTTAFSRLVELLGKLDTAIKSYETRNQAQPTAEPKRSSVARATPSPSGVNDEADEGSAHESYVVVPGRSGENLDEQQTDEPPKAATTPSPGGTPSVSKPPASADPSPSRATPAVASAGATKPAVPSPAPVKDEFSALPWDTDSD